MRHLRFHLAEFILGVLFVGLFVGLAMRTWGEFFFLNGLVMLAAVLFPVYLLVVIWMRHWRGDVRKRHEVRETEFRGRDNE